MPRDPQSGRSWTGLAARLFAAAAVSLLLLEASLRVYHALKRELEWRLLPPVAERALVPSEDPELIYEFNPGFHKPGFRINEYGMADEPVTLEKQAGVTRIAIVGDSITANFNLLPRALIYPTLLERQRSDGRVETLDFAVNGYSILQSLRMARTRVPRFHPDVLLAQLCLNDPRPSESPYTPLSPALPVRTLSFALLRLAPQRFAAYEYVEQLYDAEGQAALRRGFEGFAAISREGLPTLLVLFPYLYAPAYESWGFGALHQRFREEAARAGVDLIDLYPAFVDAGSVGPAPSDPLHPDAAGHAVAARVITEALEARGLLPPQRASLGL